MMRLRISQTVGILLVVCAALCVLVFSVYPLAALFSRSLAGDFVTRFTQTLGDSGPLVIQSAQVGIAVAVASTVLALIVAICASFSSRGMRRAVLGAALASIVSPPFLASLAYIELFGRRGLITHGLLGLSISPYGFIGVVIMQSVFFSAINVMLLLSALKGIDPAVINASRDAGASPSRTLVCIVIPLIKHSIAACLLLTFIRSLADYGTPIVIGGGLETIATAIYEQVVGYSDLESAAVLYAIYGRLIVRSRGASGLSGAAVDLLGDTTFSSLRLRGVLGISVRVVGILFVLFMIVQYGTIAHAALTRGVGWNAPFTLANIQHLISFDAGSLILSIEYALAAAVLSIILGALIAYMRTLFAHPASPVGRLTSVLEFAATMPYMLPGTCLGLGLILAFNATPLKLTGTGAIIVFALAIKQLAVSIQSFSGAFSQFDANLERAARDLGASRLEAIRDTVLPVSRRAFMVAFANAFSTAMISYSVVLFLVVPGNKTAIFELFDALSSGKYGQAAAISLAITLVVLVVNAVVFLLFGRKKERS